MSALEVVPHFLEEFLSFISLTLTVGAVGISACGIATEVLKVGLKFLISMYVRDLNNCYKGRT